MAGLLPKDICISVLGAIPLDCPRSCEIGFARFGNPPPNGSRSRRRQAALGHGRRFPRDARGTIRSTQLTGFVHLVRPLSII